MEPPPTLHVCLAHSAPQHAQTFNPLSTLRSHGLVAALAQAKRVSNSIAVNFHRRLTLVPSLAFYSGASLYNAIACILCNPMVVSSPVEEELCMRSVVRRLRVCVSGATFAGRILDSCAEGRGYTPEFVRPLVVCELREFVFGHVEGLPDSVLALQELRSNAGAGVGHAGDELDKSCEESDGCEVEE